MTWLDNLISYCDTGNAGKCPSCGSTEIGAEEHIFEKRKSLTLSCKVCGACDHFDGISEDVK